MTIGQQVRECKNDGVWDYPLVTYCLPKYPPEGYGYVDFVYVIQGAKTDVIKKNPQGIIKALVYVYGLQQDEVQVHLIIEYNNVCLKNSF